MLSQQGLAFAVLATSTFIVGFALPRCPAATDAIAFDSTFTEVPFARTDKKNIWSGLEIVPGGEQGPDLIDALNGFTAPGNNEPADDGTPKDNIPLGGDPNLGEAYIDFAGGSGNGLVGRGAVYAFGVAPGTYTLQYDASWGGSVSDAVLDAYLFDTTATQTFDHRIDFVTNMNDNMLYEDFSGIVPSRVDPVVDPMDETRIDGVELIFDNGVMTGAQDFDNVTSQPFEVGENVLVLFRMAGVGFADDSSAARLNLLRLNAVVTGLPGDYNRDGAVDAADYTAWRDNLGAPEGTLPNDTAGGPIGTAQYDVWRANFGSSSATSAATIDGARAPEPVGAASLLLGVLIATAWRASPEFN